MPPTISGRDAFLAKEGGFPCNDMPAANESMLAVPVPLIIQPMISRSPRLLPLNISFWEYNYSHLTPEERLRFELEMMANFSMLTVYAPEFDMLRRPAWKGLTMALYIAVILVGTIGNSMVVFIVARNKKLQNVTNLFIANLALSDIGLCIFSLPLQLYYQLTDNWIFGQPMCQVIFSAFAVPMHVSTLTILLIALDRYWLILYPLRERMSQKIAILLILMSTLISTLLSIPVVCYSTVIFVPDPQHNHIAKRFCIEKWPDPIYRKVYSCFMFFFQFCFPILVTGWLYLRIYMRLQSRPPQRIVTPDRKQNTNKILAAIVALFIVCWLPWNLYSLLTEIDHGIVKGSHYKFTDLILKVFAMSSACANPFLYCWLNENFRRELDTMAIKLHLYRDSQFQRGGSRRRPNNVPHYHVTPTQPRDENSQAGDSPPFVTITLADTLSNARLSASNIFSEQRSSITRLSTSVPDKDHLSEILSHSELKNPHLLPPSSLCSIVNGKVSTKRYSFSEHCSNGAISPKTCTSTLL